MSAPPTTVLWSKCSMLRWRRWLKILHQSWKYSLLWRHHHTCISRPQMTSRLENNLFNHNIVCKCNCMHVLPGRTHISDTALIRDPAWHHLGADDGHVWVAVTEQVLGADVQLTSRTAVAAVDANDLWRQLEGRRRQRDVKDVVASAELSTQNKTTSGVLES